MLCSFCDDKASVDTQYGGICMECLENYIKNNAKKIKVDIRLQTSHHPGDYHTGDECRYNSEVESIVVRGAKLPTCLSDIEGYFKDPFERFGRSGACVCCSISEQSKREGLSVHDWKRTLLSSAWMDDGSDVE